MNDIKVSQTVCPLCRQSRTVRLATRIRENRCWHVAQCCSCKLVFTDPQPTRDDIQAFYQGDYHAELRQPGASEKTFGGKFDQYCEWLLRYLNAGKSLDIGCATGLFVRKLKDRGFQAEGYEANALSAEWGSLHYGVAIQAGVFDPSTAPSKGYDLITMCDVLEHTEAPMSYLRDIRKLLNPGGHVMITFPDIWSIDSLYYRALSKVFRREWMWRTCSVPLHTWEFTPQTASYLFERTGFGIKAYGRRHDRSDDARGRLDLVSLLDLPPRALRFPALGDRFGQQMQFLLQPC
jgi:2-polyprenyl-3-methyl-5-hydroxy-6-metoxy-1,4-benzoquinol methylase